MKGKRFFILIAVICAAAIISFCGCQPFSLKNTAKKVQTVPPVTLPAPEEDVVPPVTPPAGSVTDGDDDYGYGASDSADEVQAQLAFTPISDTECEVRIANKDTAVEAYIPSTAVINGKEYTVTQIATNGFYHCPKLKKVVLSTAVKKIGDMAFGNCSELSSVTLVNVEEIGNNAFFWCPKLKELVIPKSVVYVGAYILKYNDTKVYVRGPSDEGWSTGWNGYNSGEAEFNSTFYKPMEIH